MPEMQSQPGQNPPAAQPMQQQPATPAQQPSQQPAAPPVPQAPASPQAAVIPQATNPIQAAQAPKPATPLSPQQAALKKALPGNTGVQQKKRAVCCFGAFGCGTLLFIIAIFIFLASSGENNPIFKAFGVSEGELVNILITIVNVAFMLLVFASFIAAVIGVFKFATAKKTDVEAKKKGGVLAFGAFGIMVVLVFLWITAYLFLAPRRAVGPQRVAILTEPQKTLQLTAPVTIKFDAQYAPINTGQFEIQQYEWSFGDKTTRLGTPQTHTYTDLGAYTVTLTISTKEKSTGEAKDFSFTKDVTIQNVKAKVVIEASKTKGPAPLEIEFDGSSSSSVNGEITKYEWELTEDDKFDEGTAPTAKKTFNRIGTYVVKLRVTDSTNDFAIGEKEIIVSEPVTPVAKIVIKDLAEGKKLQSNVSYIFSGDESKSPLGKIKGYQWDFGDDETSTSRNASHTFAAPGSYEVMLTVTDEEGQKGETSLKVAVTGPDAPPVPSIKTKPAQNEEEQVVGTAPLTVTFDASESSDPNEDIVEYSWDFNGDGKADKSQEKAVYTFEKAGTYTVTLTLKDATEKIAKLDIVVVVEAQGVKALLKADPTSGTVPLTVSFDGSASSYPEGEIATFEWHFGDDTPKRIDTALVKHQYTTIGTFTAKLIAIASDGKRDEVELPINVRPLSLRACFESSVEEGNAPLEVQFDPTCSTGTITRYRWKFGSAGASIERKPITTFEKPGAYEVMLEVADTSNVIDSITKKINVK